MRIERVFHNYHFDESKNTGYLYHSGSMTAKDSSLLKYRPEELKIQGSDTIYNDIFINKLNVLGSSDQQIIDNIYIAMELDRVDYRNNYNWDLYFDNYELLKNREFNGHSSLDTTMTLKITIGDFNESVSFDSINDIRSGYFNTKGLKCFQDGQVVIEVLLAEVRDHNTKCLPGYIKSFYSNR